MFAEVTIRIYEHAELEKRVDITTYRRYFKTSMASLNLTSFMSRASIGLDIGSDSIKFVKLRKSGKSWELLSYGMVPVHSLKREPSERQSMLISDVVRSVLRHEGRSQVFAALTVGRPFPSTAVNIRTITLPLMPKAELEKAIVWSATQQIPIPLEEAGYDYKILGEVQEKGVTKKEIIVAAADRSLVDEQLSLFKSAGLSVAGLSVGPLALWNLPKVAEVDLSSALIVDIGAKFTTFSFFQRNVLTLFREILTAGDSITESIMPVAVVPYEEAEILKKNFDLRRVETQGDVGEAVSASLDRLYSEIQRSFSFHQKNYPDAPINKIFLSGGTACLKGLPEAMREELGVEVEVLDPFKTMKIKLPPEDAAKIRELGPIFCTAAGLALDEGQSLNLLPAEIKGKRMVTRLARMLALPVALCIAGLLASYLYVDHEAREYRRLLSVKEVELKAALPMSQTPEEMRMAAERSKVMIDAMQELRQPEAAGALMLKEITNIVPKSIALKSLVVNLVVDAAGTKEGGAPDAAKESGAGKPGGAVVQEYLKEKVGYAPSPEKRAPALEISGVVVGEDTPDIVLARLMVALNASPYLRNPQIVSAKPGSEYGEAVLEFVLSCDLEQGGR